MLVETKNVVGSSIEGSDGTVGTVEDLMFNGDTWSVRHLVVDAGSWLPYPRVLLSPRAIQQTDWPSRRLSVAWSKQQIKDRPPTETDLPVSRRKEIEEAKYYAYGPHWSKAMGESVQGATSPNLRSVNEVIGYHIEARDGLIGHVEGFIVDDEGRNTEGWEIRYLIVHTRNWLPGKRVLIVAPRWAESISWEEKKVVIALAREVVEESPEYDPTTPVNRCYEEVLYNYYGRPKYWTDRSG